MISILQHKSFYRDSAEITKDGFQEEKINKEPQNIRRKLVLAYCIYTMRVRFHRMTHHYINKDI